MNGNPLVSLDVLSKPATVLIEKVSDAVGGICKPWQMRRVAKAEAEVDLIRAESEIQVTDLHKRAVRRFFTEEATRQSNIESITMKALPLLNEKSQPQNVENDWVTNFFDKSRIVSDEEMQRLWSRVLAGEANSPGSFSRRTVNLLGDLQKNDAELFMRLCSFSWVIGDLAELLVYDFKHEVYNHHGICFDTLGHLDSLGLVRFDDPEGFVRLRLPKKVTASYHCRRLELTFAKDADNQMELGKVLMTWAGSELARICEPKPVDGFFDYINERWAGQSLVPKRTAENAPSSVTNS